MIEEIKCRYDDRDNMAEIEKVASIPVFTWEKDEAPLYTIAIPTYNRTDLLQFAIDSCINQEGFTDYEILVVDNNPARDDETERLMKEKYRLPQIAYYKNTENTGMTGNWNKLYQLARTKWVVMLHDDDMLYPDFMRNMANIVAADNEAVCFYNCYNSMRNMGNVHPERKTCDIKVMTLKEKDYLTGCHLHAPCGMTLRRDVVYEIGGFNPDFYPSLDFHFHVKLAHYHSVRWLRGYPLATYRWMVNAGGKPETVPGWVEKDNAIKRLIVRNNFVIGSWFQEAYLRYFDKLFVRNWNIGQKVKVNEPHCMPFDKMFYLIMKFIRGLPKKLRHTYTYKPQ